LGERIKAMGPNFECLYTPIKRSHFGTKHVYLFYTLGVVLLGWTLLNVKLKPNFESFNNKIIQCEKSLYFEEKNSLNLPYLFRQICSWRLPKTKYDSKFFPTFMSNL
jgi:hypothetical protein